MSMLLSSLRIRCGLPAGRCDLVRLHHVAKRVAEGVALVGNHCGDLEIRELTLPRGHGWILLAAIEHDVDMACDRTGRDRTVSNCRKRARHSLSVGLVASGAAADVDLLSFGL